LQKTKQLLGSISALLAVFGLYFSLIMLPGLSLAVNDSGTPEIFSNTSPALITPEIREILLQNNLKAARYRTAAPDFELQDLDSRIVRLSEFRGGSCPPGVFYHLVKLVQEGVAFPEKTEGTLPGRTFQDYDDQRSGAKKLCDAPI